MTIELPAQVYGKNRDNLYTWLVFNDMMKDKPVDTAVSFEWKFGDGVYSPVWALWVEPGQEWALLYCFEDVGVETDGSRRPHTLRKSVGLCTRDALPFITSLLGGQLPEKHEVSPDGCWRIDYEQPTHVQASAWRTGLLYDGKESCYELKFSDICQPHVVSSTDVSSMIEDSSSRSSRCSTLCRFLLVFLFLLGGVVGYFICGVLHSETYDAIEAKDREIRELTEQLSHVKTEKGEQEMQIKRVRELVRQLNECLKSSRSPH